MAHTSAAQSLAAGIRALPGPASSFAATQAAWRFYANKHLTLPQLAGPLIESVRAALTTRSPAYALVIHDWSNLHFTHHKSKLGRMALMHRKDQGYQLLSSLVLSSDQGDPIGPVAQELQAQEGIYSTTEPELLKPQSHLENLTRVMDRIQSLMLGPRLVHIIDQEADAVGFYRQWDQHPHLFIVRAQATRLVLAEQREQKLRAVLGNLEEQKAFRWVQEVDYKGQKAQHFVAQTRVILHRPAREHPRTHLGRRGDKQVSGEALELRLILSQIRDVHGKLLATWLLLSNLPESIPPETISQWYYYRWRIESFFKLLKQAGYQIENWQQESARAIAGRLLIASMACVCVWELAKSQAPQARNLRQMLVNLSGRQIKRGPDKPGFTKPALLAGLSILIPMLELLESYSVHELREMLSSVLPLYRPHDSG